MAVHGHPRVENIAEVSSPSVLVSQRSTRLLSGTYLRASNERMCTDIRADSSTYIKF